MNYLGSKLAELLTSSRDGTKLGLCYSSVWYPIHQFFENLYFWRIPLTVPVGWQWMDATFSHQGARVFSLSFHDFSKQEDLGIRRIF